MYQIYKQKIKTSKFTLYVTKSRFSINCGSKFILFEHNFNATLRKNNFLSLFS